MKITKYIIAAILFCSVLACETDYNLIDTGKVNGKMDMNMWDYFKTNSYDWDSTALMIEKAELVDIFQGKNKDFKEITFLGPTNHSIRRYLYRNNLERVADMSKEECRKIILSSIIKKKLLREDIPFGKASADPMNLVGKGGLKVKGAAGNEIWLYTFKQPYNNIPEIGPVRIFLISLETAKKLKVASSNIETHNGVVHSLTYDFTIKDL